MREKHLQVRVKFVLARSQTFKRDYCAVEFSTERAMNYAMKMAGLKEVKKEQRRAIHDFVSSRDVFVSLPTGYGKSFCYALLPTVFARASIVICVSPLTAIQTLALR